MVSGVVAHHKSPGRENRTPGAVGGRRETDVPTLMAARHSRKSCHRGCCMHNEFTAIIEKDGEWYIAYCPEIPGANGQGRTIEECRESLAEAIALILEDRRERLSRRPGNTGRVPAQEVVAYPAPIR
jgi:predicted RNase H-like HicB family nuclease